MESKYICKNEVYNFRITKFLAVDCEMDLKAGQEKITSKYPGLVCKVSLINETGEIVLDTLVNHQAQQSP
jgi:hypothetical protein